MTDNNPLKNDHQPESPPWGRGSPHFCIQTSEKIARDLPAVLSRPIGSEVVKNTVDGLIAELREARRLLVQMRGAATSEDLSKIDEVLSRCRDIGE
jgi:hypothetical protein